jgi:Protein of unknown function (DUF2889)
MNVPFPGPLPGPVAEVAPPRRPNSIRRSSHVDVTRRAGGMGLSNLTSISGAGRDLLTYGDSNAGVVASATVAVSVDTSGLIDSVESMPDGVDCSPLLGVRVGFGFRSGARGLLTELSGSLLGSLVDDFSGAPAPSGYGSIREGIVLGTPPPAPPPDASKAGATQTDVCAGWRAEGLPTRHREQGVELPFDMEPPVAPELALGDDPLAWHHLGDPGDRQSRRIRRLDVWRDGDQILVDTMFRDSTVDPDPDQTQRVVHEYALSAVIAGDLSEVLAIGADPRALPFETDCPYAADSVQLIVGLPPGELRRSVGQVSRGPVSCTHLNDLMRTLADIPHLVELLP